MKVLLKLNKVINNFPNQNKVTSLLIQVPPENSVEAQLILTKNLTDRGFKIVVLSAGRPCKDLISMYKEKKINLEKIHIIDLVCRSQKLEIKDNETVTHMDTIHSLTQMSIYINKMIVPNKTILFIDSITSMLLYTDETIFTKFLSDVLRKMRIRGIHLILLFIKTKNYDTIRSELKYLCDQEVTF